MSEFTELQPFSQFRLAYANQQLQEKLITIGGGSNYGQVLFVNGGPGSGKSFVVSKFIDAAKFKVVDPDAIKKAYVLVRKNENDPEFANFDWKNPEHTNMLHQQMSLGQYTPRMLAGILKSAAQGHSDHLPNLLLDKTIKSPEEFEELVALLRSFGYSVNNMHMIWVLTNVSLALKQNASRDRMVLPEVLISAHEKIAQTMVMYLNHEETLPLNGGLYVVFNDRENVIYFDDAQTVIKDFKYLVLKQPRQPLISKDVFQATLVDAIFQRIPKTKETLHFFQMYGK